MRQGLRFLKLSILAFLFGSHFAMAQSVSIPLHGGEKFLLKAYDAHVTWTPTTAMAGSGAGSKLQINGLSESQGVRRGDLIVFDLKEVSSKDEFSSLLKKKHESLKIEIIGPSMPAEFNLHEGQVTLSQMSHETKIQMIQGNITETKSRAPVIIRLHKGNVVVQEAAAKTSIEVYSGQIALKDVADCEVDLFAGQLNVQNLNGALSLTTQTAASKVTSMNGTLTLDSQKGALSLSQFQGRLEGRTQEGSVNAQILPETEVQLKSQSGRFNFQIPKESGAYLNLWTGEGEILVPAELKVARLASEKIAKGRLRGESQKISITARTIDGVVTVK